MQSICSKRAIFLAMGCNNNTLCAESRKKNFIVALVVCFDRIKIAD